MGEFRGKIYDLSKEKTNLMPIILLFIQYSFNAQHVSAVNTTIFRSLRLIDCYFMGFICKQYRGIVLACLFIGALLVLMCVAVLESGCHGVLW